MAQCPDVTFSSNPGHRQAEVLTFSSSGYGLWSTFLVSFIISCILCAYPFQVTCPSCLLQVRPHVELVCLISADISNTSSDMSSTRLLLCQRFCFYRKKKKKPKCLYFYIIALKEQKHIGKLYAVSILILTWT